MKKQIALLSLLTLLFSHLQAQWCGKPNPNFCPNNLFTNGDFERPNPSLNNPNPDARQDKDINLAEGWLAPWGNSIDNFADLACGNSRLAGDIPNPNSGVYAGMWIIQTANSNEPSTYREGMYNKLKTTLNKSTGVYNFSFNIARMKTTRNASTNPPIAVYGVYNPSSIVAANPSSLYQPSNLNLWPSSTGVRVIKLGSISTNNIPDENWVSKSFTFSSDVSNFPNAGITHILLSAEESPLRSGFKKEYYAFDNFCMTKDGSQNPTVYYPPCCPPIVKEDLATLLNFEGNLNSYTPEVILTPEFKNRLQAYINYRKALNPCFTNFNVEYVLRKPVREPNTFDFASNTILSRGATVFTPNQTATSTWGQATLSDITLQANKWYRFGISFYGGPNTCKESIQKDCSIWWIDFRLQTNPMLGKTSTQSGKTNTVFSLSEIAEIKI